MANILLLFNINQIHQNIPECHDLAELPCMNNYFFAIFNKFLVLKEANFYVDREALPYNLAVVIQDSILLDHIPKN